MSKLKIDFFDYPKPINRDMNTYSSGAGGATHSSLQSATHSHSVSHSSQSAGFWPRQFFLTHFLHSFLLQFSASMQLFIHCFCVLHSALHWSLQGVAHLGSDSQAAQSLLFSHSFSSRQALHSSLLIQVSVVFLKFRTHWRTHIFPTPFFPIPFFPMPLRAKAASKQISVITAIRNNPLILI